MTKASGKGGPTTTTGKSKSKAKSKAKSSPPKAKAAPGGFPSPKAGGAGKGLIKAPGQTSRIPPTPTRMPMGPNSMGSPMGMGGMGGM